MLSRTTKKTTRHKKKKRKGSVGRPLPKTFGTKRKKEAGLKK